MLLSCFYKRLLRDIINERAGYIGIGMNASDCLIRETNLGVFAALDELRTKSQIRRHKEERAI